MKTEEQRNAITEARSAQNQPRTQVGELRDILETIEKRIAKLKEISSEDALDILPLLDQARERLDALDAAGGSAGSVGTQLETLLRQFEKRGALFVNRVGGPSALQKKRQAHQPDKRYWWWFIDEKLAQQRQSTMKRRAIGLVIVSAVLVVLIVVYNRFLAPDPAFQAGVGFQQSAENLLIQGQYEAALADVEQALANLPDNPELLVMQGVIYEMLDQPDLAVQSYSRAREILSDEETFYNLSAKYFLMTNLLERSIAEAERALSINPDSPISLLYIGQAHEIMGDISTALDYYEAASDAAELTGDVQLQVMARMNLAQALQRVSIPATATPTE